MENGRILRTQEWAVFSRLGRVVRIVEVVLEMFGPDALLIVTLGIHR